MQIICQLQSGSEAVEGACCSLDWLLATVCTYIDTIDIPDEVISLIFSARACLHNSLDSSDSVSYEVSKIYSGISGRPKWCIAEEQLEFLISHNFTVREMSNLLGVSTPTVERRMAEFQLNIKGSYSSCTDTQLDSVIKDIMTAFPNAGYRRMTGLLQARGLRVQQN